MSWEAPSAVLVALMRRHGPTVDEVGRTFTLGNMRSLPRVALGLRRFGWDHGATEVFVKAHP